MKQHRYFSSPCVFTRVLTKSARFWSGLAVHVMPDGKVRPSLYGRSISIPKGTMVDVMQASESRACIRYQNMLAIVTGDILEHPAGGAR